MGEASIVDVFKEGGPTMFLIIFLFTAALPLGIAAVVIGKRGPVVALVVVVGLIMLTGIGGMMMGRTATERAIPNVPADMADLLREKGYREASRPLQLAGLAALPLVVLAAAGWARAVRRS
jgi:hypothetical protein